MAATADALAELTRTVGQLSAQLLDLRSRLDATRTCQHCGRGKNSSSPRGAATAARAKAVQTPPPAAAAVGAAAMGPDIEDLHRRVRVLERSVKTKVDMSVLEELMHHLVTKTDLRSSKTHQDQPSPPARLSPEDVDIIQHQLSHTMDEKLFLVASELSAVKATYAQASAHPVLRYGQWLWKSAALRHGSGVPWNLEAHNTDPGNFRWEPDQCVVRVAEAGLYELTFAFFTKSKPSIQLVVNGESVLSAIHSPMYTVHHGSGYVTDGHGKQRPGMVTGISMIEFLCLPAKSTLCLHWHGKVDHAVEGFMGLRRLS
ncbi:hypothetical protein RI367_004426 [Sorochytrium milnesiophthora]